LKSIKRCDMGKASYFHAIINNLQESIIIIDCYYHIADVNAALCSKLRKDRRQIIGHPCYEVTHGFDEPCFKAGYECPVKSVFETGRPCRVLHQHKLSEEEYIWEEIFASPLKGENGQIIYVIEELRDATEILKERKVLQQLKSQLNILEGILPICAHCKKIRNDKGYWERIEAYICDHSEADFSHGVCPDCMKKFYTDVNSDYG